MTSPDFRVHSPYADEEQDGFMGGETKRLKTMDAWLLPISLLLIGDVSGKKILDIGAGSGTSLQTYAQNEGGFYTPLDMNSALLKERESGTAGSVIGVATGLPFIDESYDTVHMRALTAWLSEEARLTAMKEAIRVAKEHIIVINFDWSTARGGPEAEILKLLMMSILASAGYLPEYGSIQEDDIKNSLKNYKSLNIKHQVFESPDEDPHLSMIIFNEAVMTLYRQLEHMKLFDPAALLMAQHQKALNEFDRMAFSLPKLHSTVISKN
jgi:ubiquinone/menaquinone biosynthesis C-methylase UbiE